MTRLVVLLVLSLACIGPHAALTLAPDTPWVVSASEPEAVQRALDDVAADWYKVLGLNPVILREPPVDWNGPIVYLGLAGAWMKALSPEPWPGPESFCVRVGKDAAGRPAVIATGADTRGAIYAAYTLSEKLLGVDPWYFWTDHEPEYQGTVDVPDDLSLRFGPPTFQYRGWFINDEDLCNMFAPDPMRENVFSLELYDRIFETLLRLRGNMAVPATFAFPDEQCQMLAVRRGLALNMHHIQVVGLNTYRWPKDMPYSYQTRPQVLEREWQKCVDFLAQVENVWTVGYRGKHDRPFWVDDPSLNTDEKRGALITKAIATQVKMIRKHQPDAMIISNLWMEGATLYHKGYIQIPEGVVLVWPDGGDGIPRDDGHVGAGQGVYYHTAMLSGVHNQLSEMVPPGRIYCELGRFVRAGATKFFLVNVSDVRPVPLSTDCAMRFVWDASAYIDKSDQENMDACFLDWSRREFGDAVAPAVAELYAGYFNLPYHRRDTRTGDQWFHTTTRVLNRDLAASIRSGTPISATAVARARRAAEMVDACRPLLDQLAAKARELEPRVPADRRDFFRGHVRSQVELHRASNAMLGAVCTAVLHAASGSRDAVVSDLGASVRACEEALGSLRMAQYGRWRDWFRGDRFMGTPVTRDALRATQALWQGQTPPPARAVEGYTEVYQYQERFADHFPFLYRQPGGGEEHQ